MTAGLTADFTDELTAAKGDYFFVSAGFDSAGLASAGLANSTLPA